MNTHDTPNEPTGQELSLWVAEHIMGYSEPIEVAQARSLKSATHWRWAFKHSPEDKLGRYEQFVDRAGNKIYLGKPHEIHFAPDYAGLAGQDYSVLCKVRDSWDSDGVLQFVYALGDILKQRAKEPSRLGWTMATPELHYQPGDWSLAAYRAQQAVEAGRQGVEK